MHVDINLEYCFLSAVHLVFKDWRSHWELELMAEVRPGSSVSHRVLPVTASLILRLKHMPDAQLSLWAGG